MGKVESRRAEKVLEHRRPKEGIERPLLYLGRVLVLHRLWYAVDTCPTSFLS